MCVCVYVLYSRGPIENSSTSKCQVLSFFLVVDLDPTTLRTPSATTFPSGTDSWGAKILFLSIFGYDLISGISSLQKNTQCGVGVIRTWR